MNIIDLNKIIIIIIILSSCPANIDSKTDYTTAEEKFTTLSLPTKNNL